jgi:hypothetical protein
MSHLHLRCLDLVDERGQPAAAEYSPDADSGPADNEIAAAILARAATNFQRGPPAPAHAICRNHRYRACGVARVYVHEARYATQGKRSGAFADCRAGVSGVQPPMAATRPR